ncbi:hypothetical protein [Limosilactobacillus reuteri]|uniref:hypothetical protein n=1 Tax=Limosilactobacillus reuteri TaxID=1598 RepID=UPI00081BDA3D|nr:hypothetical protein [Limosilactobacillus reuteri]MCH5380231.1 hypothetical protein [Limosilactobacillus reuteri]OCW67417.1 hypothetical protein BBP13_09320 [Limosilactobacillus reuteri]OCW68416.1 hypothetical protein BBP14_08040 [Limosilactobacillus reuteri]
MKLSKLKTEPFTFTLKNDFNMTGFMLELKPEEAFESKRVGRDKFARTNTTSNVKLANNLILSEDNVSKLIQAGRKVMIYYLLEKRLDVYNYSSELDVLNKVLKY